MLEINRASGILLHVSSLPGKFGIGGMGSEANRWIDFLESTGVKYWQILPLNPTGFGNSPYQGLSAFAGNPLFINPETLCELGLVDAQALKKAPKFPKRRTDFQRVIQWKTGIFQTAYKKFKEHKAPLPIARSFSRYKKENNIWLNDFSLFMAIREENGLKSWSEWPTTLRVKDPDAIHQFHQTHLLEV